MTYSITLTNGTPLTNLQDGAEDSTTTSLNLVGRNYPGYGLFLNENFVKLLENFSNTTQPSNPLQGQLWWDSQNKELKVWNLPTGGAAGNWKVISSSQTGSVAPANPVVGDFWWNTNTSTLSVYSGSQWISIGPSNAPGTVPSIAANVTYDNLSAPHYVGNVTVNNKFAGVFSTDSTAFTPGTPSLTGGLTTVTPGLNLVGGVTAANVSTPGAVTANSVTANTLSAGTLTISNSLSVTGNVNFTGNISFPSNPSTFSNISSSITPSANLSYNLGSVTNWWNNIYGTSIHAQYADLAERFEADAVYDPGTVVELGGAAEITAAVSDLSEDVFGVISTRAAFVMNSRVGDDLTHPPIAVQGRVPVKVIGVVRKGDRLVSAGNGVARAGLRSEITTWNVIGRSLENKDTLGEGTVEAVVKLNS